MERVKNKIIILATVVAMTTLVACGSDKTLYNNLTNEVVTPPNSTTEIQNEFNESDKQADTSTEEGLPLRLELYSSRSGIITYYDKDDFFSKCVKGTTAHIMIEFAGNNKKYEFVINHDKTNENDKFDSYFSYEKESISASDRGTSNRLQIDRNEDIYTIRFYIPLQNDEGESVDADISEIQNCTIRFYLDDGKNPSEQKEEIYESKDFLVFNDEYKEIITDIDPIPNVFIDSALDSTYFTPMSSSYIVTMAELPQVRVYVMGWKYFNRKLCYGMVDVENKPVTILSMNSYDEFGGLVGVSEKLIFESDEDALNRSREFMVFSESGKKDEGLENPDIRRQFIEEECFFYEGSEKKGYSCFDNNVYYATGKANNYQGNMTWIASLHGFANNSPSGLMQSLSFEKRPGEIQTLTNIPYAYETDILDDEGGRSVIIDDVCNVTVYVSKGYGQPAGIARTAIEDGALSEEAYAKIAFRDSDKQYMMPTTDDYMIIRESNTMSDEEERIRLISFNKDGKAVQIVDREIQNWDNMINLDEVISWDREVGTYETVEMIEDAYYKVYSEQGLLGLDITKEFTISTQSEKIIYTSKN